MRKNIVDMVVHRCAIGRSNSICLVSLIHSGSAAAALMIYEMPKILIVVAPQLPRHNLFTRIAFEKSNTLVDKYVAKNLKTSGFRRATVIGIMIDALTFHESQINFPERRLNNY